MKFNVTEKNKHKINLWYLYSWKSEKNYSNLLKFNLEVPWSIPFHWSLSIHPKIIRKLEIFLYFSRDRISPRSRKDKFRKISFVWTNPLDVFRSACRLFIIRTLYLNIDTHNFFQFWRRHIHGTPVLHFLAKMFREGFSSDGENKSSVLLLYLQNLWKRTLVTLTLIWWGK